MKSGPASASLESLLLTIAQAAVALAVSERTIENLISRSELISVRVGRCRRVPRSALETYIARLVDEQAGGDVESLAPEALRLLGRLRGCMVERTARPPTQDDLAVNGSPKDKARRRGDFGEPEEVMVDVGDRPQQ